MDHRNNQTIFYKRIIKVLWIALGVALIEGIAMMTIGYWTGWPLIDSLFTVLVVGAAFTGIVIGIIAYSVEKRWSE